MANKVELKLPIIKSKKIDKAPWFEIQLFRSKLRFRNPKATAEVARDIAGRKVDARPFLNTALKAEYDCNEELGRCITNIYFSAWRMTPKKLFASSFGSLHLYLNGLGVTRGDRGVYRDLFDSETAHIWLKNYYFSRPSDLAEPKDNLKQETPFSMTAESMGSNAVYVVKPRINQIDYFVPFSAADLLQFSFQFSAKNKQTRANLEDVMQSVEIFARGMLDTVSLTQKVPDQKKK